MFGTIRRHQNWLWIIVITVIIISFVIFFSPDASFDGGGRENYGTINGKPISREEYANAWREAELRFLFNYGNWPTREELRQRGVDMDREARFRLFLTSKIKEQDIKVSEAAVAEWIANSPAFQDRATGAFRKEAYDQFVRRTLPEGRVRESDFTRFVRHEIGIQQLTEIFGLPGKLIPPAEAEAIYRQENEQMLTEVVTFSAAQFAPQVVMNPTNIAQFYTNRLALYRLPERMQVSYVKFPASDFLAEAEQRMKAETNLNATIDMLYERRGTNYYKGTNNLPLPPAEAKEKIRDEARHEYALLSARKKASEFAIELDDMKPQQVSNLSKLAAAKNLTVKETGPFSEFEPPSELLVDTDFSRQAAALSPEEPFKGPLEGSDGFYVIEFKKRIPSEVPPLESILQKVMDDYREQQALELAWQAGRKFHAQAQAALSQGKSFKEVAIEAKLQPQSLPAFSLSTRSLPPEQTPVNLGELQNVAQGLGVGKISPFNPTRDGGFVLYLQSRKPVDAAQLQKELPDFLERLRRRGQLQAFQEWFRVNIEAARITGLPGSGSAN